MASVNAHASAVSLPSASHHAPAAGTNEANQMQEDVRISPVRATLASDPCAHDASTPSSGRPSSALARHAFVEQELIQPTSRLSRLPTAVPSSPQTLTNHPAPVAISAFQNTNNIYNGQDVHRIVNQSVPLPSSTETRPFGQPSNLETSVSSSSQPLTTHGLTHPIRRPSRTSNQIFQSSSDLAAHYGIPQILPPAPRTHHTQQPANQNSALPDFQTLSANYLNMLSKPPTDTSMAAPSTSIASTISPAALEAPLIPSDEPSSAMPDYEDIFASPEFRDSNDFMSFFTPQMPELDDFDTSPFETPYADFLNTPLLDDQDAMLTSPSMEYIDDRPMFAGSEYYKPDEPAQPKASQSATLAPPLYTISPNTPNLDSFEGNHLFPGLATAPASTTTLAPPARRNKATGIRKGITPEALLDEDAPTQPRKYTTPSATSRKEVPAVFQRKRSRSAAFGDEEDQLGDDLPLNPTEKDLIEQKRRQNTVAARRSRKRKLEQFQKLQSEVDEERRLKEIWRTRAQTMLSTLHQMGVQWPDFPPDEETMEA